MSWIAAVALGWIVPGGGHMFLKRGGRGLLILTSVSLLFLLGLMMRGALFTPQGGDLLTPSFTMAASSATLAGLPYFARMARYAQADAPVTPTTTAPNSWSRRDC
jgi:hypothetical protein